MDKFDNPKHPNYSDFEQGREDAGQWNPYFTPGDRTGDALEAYKAGYAFGSECMDEYRAEYG